MQSINQTLDHLANLYLTGPLEENHQALTFSDSKTRSISVQHVRPIRVPPQRSLAAHHRSFANSDRLEFASIDEKMPLSPLELVVVRSVERPVPLAVRCPRDRRIRALVDRHGRLHLWREHIDQGIHASVVSLITARFWVRENIELIALTQPSCPFDLNAEPMLHVLTNNAEKARMLNGLLGPYLKIHVQSTPPLARISHDASGQRQSK